MRILLQGQNGLWTASTELSTNHLFGNGGAEVCQAPAFPRGVEALPIYAGVKIVLIYERDIINSKQYEGPRRAKLLNL